MYEHIADWRCSDVFGTIVEGNCDLIWSNPQHPQQGADCVCANCQPPSGKGSPAPGPARELPSPLDVPQGCSFQSRCPMVEARCRAEKPELRSLKTGASAACHYAVKIVVCTESNIDRHSMDGPWYRDRLGEAPAPALHSSIFVDRQSGSAGQCCRWRGRGNSGSDEASSRLGMILWSCSGRSLR